PLLASHKSVRPDLTGVWEGSYGENLTIRLIILKREAALFLGRMEYPGDGIVTTVEGRIYEEWSRKDEEWQLLANGVAENQCLAVRFKETRFETERKGGIELNGEYRAFVGESSMSGAWFAGERPVGQFTLRRTDNP